MKTESNKYYTPQIEEFHVGFEYRRILGDGSIQDLTYEMDEYTPIHEDMEDPGVLIRVKQLDREDIESLGFELIEDLNPKRSVLLFEHKTSDIDILMSNDNILIFDYPSKSVSKVTHELKDGSVYINDKACLFNGTIQNKSELKRLLRQVGVI